MWIEARAYATAKLSPYAGPTLPVKGAIQCTWVVAPWMIVAKKRLASKENWSSDWSDTWMLWSIDCIVNHEKTADPE